MRIKFYRIENMSGRGPWNTYYDKGQLDSVMYTYYRKISEHPLNMPCITGDCHDEIISQIPEGYFFTDYFCGFVDMDQMKEWFHSEAGREFLVEYGLTLHEYEIDEEYVIYSDRQLVFLRQFTINKREIPNEQFIRGELDE